MTLRFLNAEQAAATDLPWPDLYFAPGYGAAVEQSDGADWEVAVWEPGPILLPALRRPIDPALGEAGLVDLTAPYGYPGAWSPESVPDAEWTAFRRAYKEAARERGVVAEFLRLSALVPGADRLAAADPDLEVETLQDTILLDLSEGYDAWWTGAQGRCRTSVRKARKKGWTASARPASAEDLAPGSPFRRLYEGTMRGLGTTAYYLFADGYYDALRAACGEDLWIVLATRGDDVGAASLFCRWGNTLHYHLSGSDLAFRNDGVNNLVLEAAIARAVDQGLDRFHLGGGTGGEDPLFKFKVSFGGARLPYRVGRCVLDPARYDRLVRARAAQTDRTVDALRARGWFPAYRA